MKILVQFLRIRAICWPDLMMSHHIHVYEERERNGVVMTVGHEVEDSRANESARAVC